jgi:nicotinate-nucleotide adenylyltransferase
MLRLAVDKNDLLEPSDLELKRTGPSYTLETIRQVRRETGETLPCLALGMDAYREIGTWYKPVDVLAEAHIAVLTRPGFDMNLLSPIPPEYSGVYRGEGDLLVHSNGATLRTIQVTSLDISSSMIRDLARNGRSIRYLVPEAVFEYIQRKGVYES